MGNVVMSKSGLNEIYEASIIKFPRAMVAQEIDLHLFRHLADRGFDLEYEIGNLIKLGNNDSSSFNVTGRHVSREEESLDITGEVRQGMLFASPFRIRSIEGFYRVMDFSHGISTPGYNTLEELKTLVSSRERLKIVASVREKMASYFHQERK